MGFFDWLRNIFGVNEADPTDKIGDNKVEKNSDADPKIPNKKIDFEKLFNDIKNFPERIESIKDILFNIVKDELFEKIKAYLESIHTDLEEQIKDLLTDSNIENHPKESIKNELKNDPEVMIEPSTIEKLDEVIGWFSDEFIPILKIILVTNELYAKNSNITIEDVSNQFPHLDEKFLQSLKTELANEDFQKDFNACVNKYNDFVSELRELLDNKIDSDVKKAESLINSAAEIKSLRIKKVIVGLSKSIQTTNEKIDTMMTKIGKIGKIIEKIDTVMTKIDAVNVKIEDVKKEDIPTNTTKIDLSFYKDILSELKTKISELYENLQHDAKREDAHSIKNDNSFLITKKSNAVPKAADFEINSKDPKSEAATAELDVNTNPKTETMKLAIGGKITLLNLV